MSSPAGKSTTVFMYQTPHPSHSGFSDAVGADNVNYHYHNLPLVDSSLLNDVYNGIRFPIKDYVLVEGSRPLFVNAIRRGTSDCRSILIASDHGFFKLGSPQFEGDTFVKQMIGRHGRSIVQQVARRTIDGVIAVSDFCADYTRPFVAADTPIRVVNPFILPNVQEDLSHVTPDVSSYRVVTVGRGARYKGIDMLVECWPQVRESFPEATLDIVGKGHPTWYDTVEGVENKGYVDALSDVFDSAALYVQPSRVDAFGVSVVEAMAAGLPAIVTNTTGAKSAAEQISPAFVVDPKPIDIANRICTYFDERVEEKRTYSTNARRIGNEYSEERQLARFYQAFEEVVAEIEQSS